MASADAAFVVDASAAVELVVGSARGARVAQAVHGAALFAPEVFDAEVLHALRGLERAGVLDGSAVDAAVQAHLSSPVRRVSGHALAPGAWNLRANVSIYDAMYVALAQELRCPVVTLDRKWATFDVEVPLLTIS